MGLHVSHNAFNGPYPAFNRFRQVVAWASGGSFPPHQPGSTDLKEDWFYVEDASPGLMEFLKHSDCEGEIHPRMCKKIAEELSVYLVKADEYPFGGLEKHVYSHKKNSGVLSEFIDGCLVAFYNSEFLKFY